MAYGKEEKKGFKTYQCEFPGCGKTISRRKSTIVYGTEGPKRLCRSHVKSMVINVDTTKASTNSRYRLFTPVFQSTS